MNYALLVTGSPHASQSHQSALNFARAALTRGHRILRVFFYAEAVAIGNSFSGAVRNEAPLAQQWQEIAQAHNIDLVICVTAAIRRGVLDTHEAKRYNKPASNLHSGFVLSGLGQLVEASQECDRLITFAS